MASEFLPFNKYQVKDVVPLSFIVVTSVWLLVLALKKWTTVVAPSTPDLEKTRMKSKEKPARKPGGMSLVDQYITDPYRMDPIILQTANSLSIPRLGRPHN